jgi:hypothetical protein
MYRAPLKMLLVPFFQGRIFHVFSAIKALDDEEEDEEGVHMCASSIAQHFLPKNTLGRKITNLSPHFHKKSPCFFET